MKKLIFTISVLITYSLCAFAQSPIIYVEPDSLSENLFSGKSSTQLLTIFNNGGSDLIFNINILGSSAKNKLQSLVTSDNVRLIDEEFDKKSNYSSESPEVLLSNRPYSGNYISSESSSDNFTHLSDDYKLMSNEGLKILLISSAEILPDDIRNALLGFSDIQLVDVFDARSATPNLIQLLPYQSVIIMDNLPFYDPITLGDVLADYVDLGGGLIIAIASFVSGWEIQGRLLSEEYFPFNLGSGPAGSASLGTYNHYHPIMQGVTGMSGDLLAEVTVADSAELVASWNNGFPFIATKGMNVVAVNVFVPTPWHWGGDIPLVLHNAAYWAGGCNWLSAEPDSGIVSAGSSINLEIKFYAAGMRGGEYEGNIVISSNDPVTTELTVPAHLNVTDAPSINVDTNYINFGELFLGVTDTFTLEIKNLGSQDLLIFSAVIQPNEYTVSPTFAGIDPGENEIFTITFLPQVVGNYPGTLTFNSNDPLFGNYIVDINGSGVEPPNIVVSPDSLVVELLQGTTTTEILTISNLGGSNLYFDISSNSNSNNFALQFDGVNDIVAGYDDGLPVGNSSRTIELWFNRISQPVDGGQLLGYGSWGNYEQAYTLSIGNDRISFSQWGWGVDGSTVIQNNHLYHFSVVNVGNDIVVYLNGELDGSGSCNINTVSNGFYFIGKAPPPYDDIRRFNGVIDDIRIWNVARTQQEIQQYMKQELDGSEQGLVGYWQFNEGIGDTAYDMTDNANHGLLQGGVLWTNSSAPLTPLWLLITPDSGVCSPNSTLDLEVLFDATELDGGDYYGSLIINSNDPVSPSVTISVHLIVEGVVGVENEINLPTVYELYQNYPNPFNPTTSIEFSLPVAADVQLIVYNVLGQQVASLINEQRSAGNHSILWNANDSNGMKLSSGIYLYKLKVTGNDGSEFQEIKKMILLK